MIVDISNKVVVITGSSRGIGSDMAKRFAKENAKVVINYFNSYENAKNTYNEILVYNKNCIMVRADVTKQEDVKRLCAKTIEAFGQVDVLINNAGICSDNILPMMTEKQWNDVININLTGIFLCSKIFAKEMIKKRQGRILNIASLKGQIGSEGQTNYSASKAGVIGFTKALAKELGRFNISVNAICPGFIETDLNRNNKEKLEKAKNMSVMALDNCLAGLLDFLVFISSDRLSCVSGKVFSLDSRIT